MPGRLLIESIYKGQSISVLNRLITGQNLYPLEYYFKIFYTLSLSLFWFAYLLGLIVLYFIIQIRKSLKSITKQKIFKIIKFFTLAISGSFLLLWLAFYNGYPLVFPDSARYIGFFSPETHLNGYNIFILFANLLYKSAWTIIVLQTFITSVLLLRISYLVLPKYRSGISLSILGALIMLTDISKYASWIMPDIFTSWLFLGLMLFVLSPKWYDRFLASGVIAVSFLSHMTHIGIAFFSLILLFAAGVAYKTKISKSHILKISIKIGFLIFTLFISLCALNLALSKRLHLFPRQSKGFIISGFASRGLLSKTLDGQCLEKVWKLCKYRDQIRANIGNRAWYMWDKDSPRAKEDLTEKEQEEIIFYTYKNNFFDVFKNAISSPLIVLSQYDALYGIDNEDAHGHGLVYDAIQITYPKETTAFLNSRQEQGSLGIVTILPFNYKITLFSIAFFAFWALCLFIYKKEFYFVVLILSPFIFILLNAATFLLVDVSPRYSRYNTRVLWLMPYCLFLAIATYLINIFYDRTKKRSVRCAP